MEAFGDGLMNKRHENKYPFDPGRLRHSIEIYRIANTETEDGGSETSEVLCLSARAGIITKSVPANDYGSQQITDGVTYFVKLKTYVIRYRRGLKITPDMILIEDGVKYEIVGEPIVDDPKTFILISCSKL